MPLSNTALHLSEDVSSELGYASLFKTTGSLVTVKKRLARTFAYRADCKEMQATVDALALAQQYRPGDMITAEVFKTPDGKKETLHMEVAKAQGNETRSAIDQLLDKLTRLQNLIKYELAPGLAELLGKESGKQQMLMNQLRAIVRQIDVIKKEAKTARDNPRQVSSEALNKSVLALEKHLNKLGTQAALVPGLKALIQPLLQQVKELRQSPLLAKQAPRSPLKLVKSDRQERAGPDGTKTTAPKTRADVRSRIVIAPAKAAAAIARQINHRAAPQALQTAKILPFARQERVARISPLSVQKLGAAIERTATPISIAAARAARMGRQETLAGNIEARQTAPEKLSSLSIGGHFIAGLSNTYAPRMEQAATSQPATALLQEQRLEPRQSLNVSEVKAQSEIPTEQSRNYADAPSQSPPKQEQPPAPPVPLQEVRQEALRTQVDEPKPANPPSSPEPAKVETQINTFSAQAGLKPGEPLPGAPQEPPKARETAVPQQQSVTPPASSGYPQEAPQSEHKAAPIAEQYREAVKEVSERVFHSASELTAQAKQVTDKIVTATTENVSAFISNAVPEMKNAATKISSAVFQTAANAACAAMCAIGLSKICKFCRPNSANSAIAGKYAAFTKS